MCENGRVVHHLKNAVSDEANTIMIIGFQAEHTLGRQIVERRPELNILGRRYPLKARVEIVNGLSAHADAGDFQWWFGALQKQGGAGQIFVVHGEDKVCAAMAKLTEDCSSLSRSVIHGVPFKGCRARNMMSDKIVIPCSECGSNMSVPGTAAGKKVRCSKCKGLHPRQQRRPSSVNCVRQPCHRNQNRDVREVLKSLLVRPADVQRNRYHPLTMSGWTAIRRHTMHPAVNGILTARRNNCRKLFRRGQNAKTSALRHPFFADPATRPPFYPPNPLPHAPPPYSPPPPFPKIIQYISLTTG